MNTQRGLVPVVIVVGLVAAMLLAAAGYSYLKIPNDKDPGGGLKVITSFEECIAAGYPVAESYPRQCTAGNFGTFIETIPADSSCATVLCPTDTVCEQGKCVKKDQAQQDPCMWTRCMAGYRCEWGKCIKIDDACAGVDCGGSNPYGYHCENGRCVENKPVTNYDTCVAAGGEVGAPPNGGAPRCQYNGQVYIKENAAAPNDYRCMMPCTGTEYPVDFHCDQYTTQATCTAFQSSQPPYRCSWRTPGCSVQ